MGNRRGSFLINPRFQLRMLAYAVGMAVLVVGGIYAAHFLFFHRFIQLGLTLGLPDDHVFFGFLRQQQRTMNYFFAGISILTLAVLLVGGLLLSHRIAGPLYRLRRHLEQISEGEPVREVKFRTHDYFQELAEAFNRIIGRLK